jgi:hypothetical protein
MLNELAYFYKMYYEGNAVEGDLYAKLFNPAALFIPKWWCIKYMRWK